MIKTQITFPEKISEHPANWDFVSTQTYSTKIVENEPNVVLYDAIKDNFKNFLWPRQWYAMQYKIEKKLHKVTSKDYLSIYTDSLIKELPDLSFKILLNDIAKRSQNSLVKTTSIVLTAFTRAKKRQKVQVGLQLKNGQVFGKVIELTSNKKDIIIPFHELENVSQVVLPKPFPPFQSYFLNSLANSKFDVKDLEAIQISIGPEIKKENYNKPQQVFINKIVLQ